jgi:AAHS family 4-hydroxybenzoate transporter-like MFS transporter
MTASTLSLPGFIDDRRISPFQWGVVLLCGLVMFLDGFNTQGISYMAPAIAKEWHLSKGALGPIFSSALVGLMIGYLALSPLSDRFGHRPTIIAATAIFALATLGSIGVHDLTQLKILRLITGLGLGAAAPSAVALTGEFSPKRLRATFVLIIYCGFSAGFVVAGMTAGALIPTHGWRSMFVAGAVAPLLLLPALVLWLPESLAFLARRGRHERATGVIRRIDPSVPEDARLQVDALAKGRASLAALFTGGMGLGTVLLWVVFAINLGEFYALQSWLPTILGGLHYSTAVVVGATTLTTVGGIVAAFITGPCMDRLGAYGTVAAIYVLGFLFMLATGAGLHAGFAVLMAVNFLSGCCISGGQKSVIALAAVFYPADVRSTGVGWALGIGRIGGILAPLWLGAALERGTPPPVAFYVMALPLLLGAALVVWLGRSRPSLAGRIQNGVMRAS